MYILCVVNGVFFGPSDFVEATRSIFQENLEEQGLGTGPFMFSYHEAASLMDTSAFHSPVRSGACLCSRHLLSHHWKVFT